MSFRMRSKATLLLIAIVAAALAFACGGGDDEPVIPSPTPDAFDLNLLSAIALQQDEVDGLPIVSSTFSGDGDAIVYTVRYGDEVFGVQSVVARVPFVASREQYFEGLRLASISLVKNEQNYTLEGTELAFTYEGRSPEQVVQAAVLTLRGDFITYFVVSSNDRNRTGDVIDDAKRLRYAEAINERVRQAIESPAELTPPDSAPTYAAD